MIGYPKDNDNFQVLTVFYEKNNTLPFSAEKFIISLFRKMLMYDVEIEELQTVQTSTNVRRTNPEVLKTAQEKTGESMDVGEIEDLPKLFISPAEKFMDEFNGNSKDLKGLFKVPKEMNFEANLHQQICNTAKNQYEGTGGEIFLYGIAFTEDEQIGNWISRTNGRYETNKYLLL